jgi:DNA helicase HerA-like ATPase
MAVEIGRAKFPDPKSRTGNVIFWDPSTAISGHAILVGSSGVGKTHRLRYLIRHLIGANRNINIHILDVHGDIAPAARNRVVFSEITDYGLNPLEVVTDPEFGGVRRRINSFIAMINRTTSKLGVRQEAALRALLGDLYQANGYDPKNPRTWDPRTNPFVRGRCKESRTHPNISDLAAMCAWRLNVLVTGGGADAYKALNEVNKLARKLNKEAMKDEASDDARLESLVLQAVGAYEGYLKNIKSGRELEDYIKYDSQDTLKAVYERIKGLDATGIFKDKPPQFSHSDPLRVYDIKALSEDEQSMFAEVLLERLFVEAKARGQKDIPDTFIIIDEAHKFMSTDGEHIMNRMAREVRKFGVGLILVSQNFDHFPEDLIANSAMTMILGLHDMHHRKAETRLGLKPGRLKFIKPKQTALVQVRSGTNSGLTNTFNDVILAA